MINLLRKELRVFFKGFIGYLIIGFFLLITSLFLWTNLGEFNILEYGYANMNMFFEIAPILFFIFIPAVSMRSFSEEYSTGTIEILITKPISTFKIVFAKFFSVLVLSLFSILLTSIYIISIYFLGENIGNLDLASVLGSYIGLFFLTIIFSSIGIFSSSLSSNQVISFIISMLICFLFYFGFDILSDIEFLQEYNLFLKQMGIAYHYDNMSKGLLRISDIIYFSSVCYVFLIFTKISLNNRL